MSSNNELIERIESKGTIFGHPKGLFLLFFTEMWERFSYYGMRGILMLYMTKLWMENGLNIDSQNASLIYGFFTGFVYFTPLFGGLIADRWLGQRLSITIGGITMFIGQLVLFTMNTHFGLGLGLVLLVIGNGFFKPNISTIVGQMYRDGDPKKDAAFSIFYMGINLGALLAPFVIGTLAEDTMAVRGANGEIISYGFKYGFLVAAIGMGLGQIMFNLLSKKYLLELGEKPVVKTKEEKKAEKEAKANIHVDPAMKKIERQRLWVIVILTFFVIFFWAGFEQAGSSLTLYTDKYIDRNVGGWEIPTTFFQGFNPILIVAFAPIFAWLWTTKLFSKMSTPVKMSLGMILLGLGFLFMLMATFEVKTSMVNGEEVVKQKAALIWLLLTYFLHTIGELCLSPVGLSMVTKMAPVRLVSLMMGVWMLSSFFANILGGFVAKYTEVMGAYTIFYSIAVFVIVLGLVLLLISRKISKLMNGVV